MLTKEGCLTRRERLWKMVSEDVEWLLIADPRHVHYLSNFWVQPFSFSVGERGYLLLEREAGATLLADNFTIKSVAGQPHVEREVVGDWYDHKHSVINRDHALFSALKTVSERLFGRKGAVEAEALPLGAFEILGLDHESHSISREANDQQGAGSVDLGTVLRGLRRQKEPDEISLMKQCMRATEAGHARAREIIKPGITDYDVFREVYAAALEAAGRPAMIYGDFRANSALEPKSGGLPVGHTLQAGDLFVLDYSILLDGYRSDFTNVISVGPPSNKQLLLFSQLQASLEAGAKSLKAGVLAKDVYAAASKPLIDAGYSTGIPHHAGHGIGMGHPEPPILVPESHDVLLTGDVVTLEPGLYIEGTGGMRIEHNYLINDTGYEQLSNHLISLT